MNEIAKKGTKKDIDNGKNISKTTRGEETEANVDKRDSSHEQPKEQNMHENVKYTDQCTVFISNLDPKVS